MVINTSYSSDYLVHFGVQGQKWGVRRYQYEDGSLTPEGKEHYGRQFSRDVSKLQRYSKRSDARVQTRAAKYRLKATKYDKKVAKFEKRIAKKELKIAKHPRLSEMRGGWTGHTQFEKLDSLKARKAHAQLKASKKRMKAAKIELKASKNHAKAIKTGKKIVDKYSDYNLSDFKESDVSVAIEYLNQLGLDIKRK